MQGTRTFTAFLLSTMKLSARCIMNRVNLWHSIRSISSACLILILIRTELTDGSMRTRSFSFLEIVRGLSRTSFEALHQSQHTARGHVQQAVTYATSTSGLLCRSTTYHFM